MILLHIHKDLTDQIDLKKIAKVLLTSMIGERIFVVNSNF